MSDITSRCATIGCKSVATHEITYPATIDGRSETCTDAVCKSCGEEFARRPALQATMTPLSAPQSGYTPCACRDCMDVAVSSDMSAPDLCGACKEAECTNHANLPSFITAYGLGYECQREDAYGNEVCE